MIWFVVGGVLGLVQLWISLRRKPSNHSIAVLVIGAALGAAVYGTILWFIWKSVIND